MFRRIDETISVSGQIQPKDVWTAKAAGVKMIVNNRPDGEEAGQPASAEIGDAAQAAGLDYRHVPVSTLSLEQVAAMTEALDAADGPVLAFCKSGTRSTYLWALAGASRGADAEELVRKAAAAGYNLSPIRAQLG